MSKDSFPFPQLTRGNTPIWNELLKSSKYDLTVVVDNTTSCWHERIPASSQALQHQQLTHESSSTQLKADPEIQASCPGI